MRLVDELAHHRQHHVRRGVDLVVLLVVSFAIVEVDLDRDDLARLVAPPVQAAGLPVVELEDRIPGRLVVRGAGQMPQGRRDDRVDAGLVGVIVGPPLVRILFPVAGPLRCRRVTGPHDASRENAAGDADGCIDRVGLPVPFGGRRGWCGGDRGSSRGGGGCWHRVGGAGRRSGEPEQSEGHRSKRGCCGRPAAGRGSRTRWAEADERRRDRPDRNSGLIHRGCFLGENGANDLKGNPAGQAGLLAQAAFSGLGSAATGGRSRGHVRAPGFLLQSRSTRLNRLAYLRQSTGCIASGRVPPNPAPARTGIDRIRARRCCRI